MVCIRPFAAEDAETVAARLPGVGLSEAERLILDWNTGVYDGKPFLMFAVTADGEIVGNVSVYVRSKDIASLGIEIYPEFRRNGYAEQAIRFAERQAMSLGCTELRDEVRADNAASAALHRRLGFTRDGSAHRNAKGREVYEWRKEIATDDMRDYDSRKENGNYP